MGNFNHKDYYKANKKRRKLYLKKNAKTIKKQKHNWYLDNKDVVKLRTKKYKIKNKVKVNKLLVKAHTKKMKTDIIYRLKNRTRSMICRVFKRNGFKKNTKTKQILGCTFNYFKVHLESQFKEWMDWENKGLYNGKPNYGWDVDHIIPLSTAKTIEDVLRLNHYTNLQPLCSFKNRVIKKG